MKDETSEHTAQLRDRAEEAKGKVLIIGSGCTGCALGQGLKKAGIAYAIYEARDSSKPAREWNMGLHWAVPGLKSIIPEPIWANIQNAQVDPHYATGVGETIPFSNGETGKVLGMLKMDYLYRVHRNRLRTLLAEGLDVQEGKALVDVSYSDGGKSITAHFSDGSSDIGWLLVGSDGPKSTVRSLLLDPERAKTKVLDYASTMCFTKYTRSQALFLRSPPAHPLFQVAPHPKNFFGVLGLHDAPDPDEPENWTFFHYISFLEPVNVVNKGSKRELVAHQKRLATLFADPLRSAFEWMPDDNENVWYGKLNHWDPSEAGHSWDNHDGRVTLAGDAAHPMTFQRGQGLNHAIDDAVKLSEAISKVWWNGKGPMVEERLEAVSAYECEMVERGGEEVRLSAKNTGMLHDWGQMLQSPMVKNGVNRTK